jgi:hypothetical protein
MRSTGARVGLLALLAAVAVGLFVVLSDDDGDDGDGGSTTTATETTTGGEPAPSAQPPPEVIEMKDGAPVGGVKRLEYEKGDEVWLLIKLDEAQEDIHIHGYGIELGNPQRGNQDLTFTAELDGVYELEAHGPSGDVLLAELRISP